MLLFLLFNRVVSAGVNEDEIGPYWTPLGLVLRLKPDGKVEATDIHDDVSVFSSPTQVNSIQLTIWDGRSSE